MTDSGVRPVAPAPAGHAGWVRVTHWLAAVSLLILAGSGFWILRVHPRLYWGDAGNDLMPALIELPISPNYPGRDYSDRATFEGVPGGVVTANRNREPWNQNGWARSLHFLAAWGLVVPGLFYLFEGLFGHFRSHLVPGRADLDRAAVTRDLSEHVRFKIRPATGGPSYGPLQKVAYTVVVFGMTPLLILSGLAMAPAVTAAFPWILAVLGGHQSARTIHFLAFAALLGFVAIHLVMVAASGLRHQLRGMTIGRAS